MDQSADNGGMTSPNKNDNLPISNEDGSSSAANPSLESSGGSANNSVENANNSSANAQSQQPRQPHYSELRLSYNVEDYTHPSVNSNHDLKHSYSWETILTGSGGSNGSNSTNNPATAEVLAVPVTSFGHAPMSDCWDNIIVGMKVEVENRDVDSYPGVFANCFWVASVLRISGYHVLLRYEGFGQDGSRDFWINMCSDKIHPVGWCATRGKPLIPPRAIKSKQQDWKDYLVKRLTGARTIPQNFYAKIWQTVGSKFRAGMKLEVVDKMRICQVRVATVQEITGRRLFLQYDDVDHDDKGFWCHEESPLIHPVGWAKRVGHQVVANKDYYDRCAAEEYAETDCTADMFPEYKMPPGSGNFVAGMKIEAVDPLNLASICVATVMKVLRFGYIMIRIDGYETDETGSDWFCYHGSSPLIFPPGYCERRNIKLKPPTGWEDNFTWHEYLKETKSTAAPMALFGAANRDEVKHGFREGMKLEAADQMDPRLICVSTVSRILGRLLKIHFDGWEDEYDQWMDCESADIYPVGWGELVGHKLEGPRQMPPQKREKRKPVGRKGKKRASAGNSGVTTPSILATPTSNAPKKSKSKSPTNPNETEAAASSAANANTETDIPKVEDEQAPVDEDTENTEETKMEVDEKDDPKVEEKDEEAETKAEEDEEEESAKTEAEAETATPSPPLLTPQTSLPEKEAKTESKETASLSQPAVKKVIPVLVDSSGQQFRGGRDSNLDPASWSVEDVAEFLEVNECASLSEFFKEKGVDGTKFLSLGKEEIMALVNKKIGPCLKIENLLSLLKAKMNPAQARFLATIRKNVS